MIRLNSLFQLIYFLNHITSTTRWYQIYASYFLSRISHAQLPIQCFIRQITNEISFYLCLIISEYVPCSITHLFNHSLFQQIIESSFITNLSLFQIIFSKPPLINLPILHINPHHKPLSNSTIKQQLIKAFLSKAIAPLNIMQADVNKTKSRSYNYFLRHFHIGLRILAVIFSTRIVDQYESCPQTFSRFVLPLAISLTVLNLAFMVYFLCRDIFPRCQFFLFSSVNIVLSSVIGLLTYSYFNNGVRCKKNMILQSYIVLEVIFNIPICLLALMAKFSWAQRYTNTPGNLIWTIVIISFAQDMSFVPQIQAVAWITALISVSSLTLNVVTLITGITPSIKRAILIQWVISLVLIVVCAFMALVVFLNNYLLKQYANQILSNICLKYILVAIIDVGFWIWGLLTLTYENGDYIRNAILNNSYHDHDQGKNEAEPYFDGEWFNIHHGFAPLKST